MRRAGWCLLIVALATASYVATAQLSNGSHFSAGIPHYDSKYAHYLDGYLAWKDGTGKIHWTKDYATDDPGGRGVYPVGAQATVGWNARLLTGQHGAVGQSFVPYDEFVSEPLPRDHYVNSTIATALVVYASGCSRNFEAVVFADGVIFAGYRGGLSTASPNEATSASGVALPMHPESDVLRKGVRLTVRLYYYGPDTAACAYGLTGDHASRIRIPLYPPEELVMRVPELQPKDDPDTGGEGAVAGAAAIVAAVGRRRRAPLVVGLLMAVAMAGCTASKPLASVPLASDTNANRGFVNSSIIEDEDNITGLAGSGRGSIAGSVSNEVGQPIRGAHVSVLGSPLFNETDGYGRYAVKGLAPGAFRVRFEAPEYHFLETDVQVKAESITKLDVTLLPLVDAGRDFRPHKHDTWPGPSKKIYETTKRFSQDGSDRYFCGPNTFDFVFYVWIITDTSYCFADLRIPSGGPDPPLVLPGTRDIEVTVSWDTSNLNLERVGVYFTSPVYDQPVFMFPRGNGATTHIATSWESTDAGHQRRTAWRFALYVPTNAGGPGGSGITGPRADAQLTLGDFRVTITIHKGVVPLEPAHRDFWKGADQKTIVFKANGHRWEPKAPELVPPGTQWLEVTRKESAGGGSDVLSALPDDREFGLKYKPADWDAWEDAATWKTPVVVSRSGDTSKFRAKLESGEADPEYAKGSNFALATDVITKGDSYAVTDDVAGVRVRNVPLPSLTVVAHRDEWPG